jgi:hypothetical protein
MLTPGEISPAALGALRVAATLTHLLPGLRARVRLGSLPLVDVATPGPGGAIDQTAPRVLSPCAFRSAVAHAHQRRLAGERLSFLNLPAGVDPAIDLATPPGGTSRPGGLYRVRAADRWLWAFATTLDAAVAHDLGRCLVDETPLDGELRALGIRPDPATEVSIAYAETTAAPGSRAEAAVVDLLESLLARWTAHELVSASTAGTVAR